MLILEDLKPDEMMGFINREYCDDFHQNWLVEHEFANEIKAGD